MHRYFRWTFYSILSGILAGLAAAIFIYALNKATELRDSYPALLYMLPLGGFVVGWIYHRYGQHVVRGTNLILDEIHDPKNVIPVQIVPMVLFGSIITHLFGGSAGREGAIVQVGSSLSDQLSRVFKIEREERKILLTSGAGAAFGAAMGAPWAGVVFGMEVIEIGKLKTFALFEGFVASFISYYTTIILGVQHQHYVFIKPESFEANYLFYILIAGIIFGLTANLFSKATHQIERMHSTFIKYSPLRPLIAGILLVFLFNIEGMSRYMGLGIANIHEALAQQSSFQEPLFKFFFTVLTVGSGFKGGEFTPLVYIGATLGSALAVLLPVASSLLAAVGFVAVFAGASNTPIACSIMAIEIFGKEIAPYAIVACFASYFFSGYSGIYKSQKNTKKKQLFKF